MAETLENAFAKYAQMGLCQINVHEAVALVEAKQQKEEIYSVSILTLSGLSSSSDMVHINQEIQETIEKVQTTDQV